ncbi:hypothetical protein HanXRQr2_Chr17g0799021 [Helianthus annuus]|uniref:Uncharacterized protein n=1 Tax=Helianthus annuus TaxID=4232 RepID=A0A9K3DI74_HELAN|nr:hypothetical protein HanXRQr2_Chr17g0799021 [Helianthus annuus]KAJ0812852.1 hypothetical protein HanPSC8_Chr17g0766651 [Helianthus annuus]
MHVVEAYAKYLRVYGALSVTPTGDPSPRSGTQAPSTRGPNSVMLWISIVEGFGFED